MDRKLGGVIVFLFSCGAFAQSAPFCVISGYGGSPQCFYYDLNSCRTQASYSNGMCAANVQAQQQQVIQPITPYVAPRSNFNLIEAMNQSQRAAAEGAERGRQIREARERARMEQEEHQARMRYYETQTQQVQSSQRQGTWGIPIEGTSLFRCTYSNGVQVISKTEDCAQIVR